MIKAMKDKIAFWEEELRELKELVGLDVSPAVDLPPLPLNCLPGRLSDRVTLYDDSAHGDVTAPGRIRRGAGIKLLEAQRQREADLKYRKYRGK